MPEHRAEVHHRHRQDQGQPEPVLEHCRAVPGVLAVGVDDVVIVGAVSFVVAVMAGCGGETAEWLWC